MMKNLLTTLVFWFKNSFSWLFLWTLCRSDRQAQITDGRRRMSANQQTTVANVLGIVCDHQFTSRIYDVADVAIASVYIPNCRRSHNRASAKPGSTDCCSFCCAALPPLPPQAHPTKKIIRRWSSISAREAQHNAVDWLETICCSLAKWKRNNDERCSDGSVLCRDPVFGTTW